MIKFNRMTPILIVGGRIRIGYCGTEREWNRGFELSSNLAMFPER